jgi:hypothetical protein
LLLSSGNELSSDNLRCMTDRHQITSHVQLLESDRVKALVLDWLAGTSGSLADFEQLLEADYAVTDAEELSYGELDAHGMFQPLTEAEMAAKSLQVLEEYKRTREGVPHEQVGEWLDSIGTDNPLPCPR